MTTTHRLIVLHAAALAGLAAWPAAERCHPVCITVVDAGPVRGVWVEVGRPRRWMLSYQTSAIGPAVCLWTPGVIDQSIPYAVAWNGRRPIVQRPPLKPWGFPRQWSPW